MATVVQIRETKELSERPRFLGPQELRNGATNIEGAKPQPESPSIATDAPRTTHPIYTLLRALASILIAPFLLAAALVIFLFALADFSWFRLRDLRNGQSHPKGLWEF
jgi:hypothetical protein